MESALSSRYAETRRATADICAALEVEDYVVQPADDVSPPKWHLGHTTWFFETFVLERHEAGYESFHPQYRRIFNSYYQSVGSPYPRARRGTLSRPTVREIYAYRDAIDRKILRLLSAAGGPQRPGLERAVELGLHHEQQHQELLICDIKYIFAHNAAAAPLDAFSPGSPSAAPVALGFARFEGGIFRMGHQGGGFSFDNETPAHDALVAPFRLANRLSTNGEYAEFIRAGGYRDHRHWLSDGWERVNAEGWTAPLYWDERDDPAQPVCHLSYYEADAFARWAGKRLPTEAEWELAVRSPLASKASGRLMEDGRWRPAPAVAGGGGRVLQMTGDAWEWTASAYAAYPGFRPLEGAFGEYNGKFMSNQFVLRGGSCATPRGHVRPTYRNFFQGDKRWQFCGVRLAENI